MNRKQFRKPQDKTQSESPFQAIGPEIGIQQESVTYGLIRPHTEPGYILKDGAVLLESERDAYGNYLGGAGAGGMLLKTGRLYAPVLGDDGKPRAFRELQPVDNYLRSAEMGAEQNYNQIDGIINNEPPRPSVLADLEQNKAAADAQGKDTGRNHKPYQGPER